MQAPPIYSVPNDVLQEIFVQCLSDNRWRIGLSPLDAPVLLTHICNRWRTLALGFPKVWQSLRWDTHVGELNVQKQLDIVAAAAGRAKLAPRSLQVIIRQNTPSSVEAQKAIFKMLPDIPRQLLNPPAPSLTRLVLKGVPIAQIHATPNGSFPSLVRLVLHLDGTDLETFPWSTKGPVTAFSDTPALRGVGMGSSFPFNFLKAQFVSGRVLLPWEQLTHVLDFAPSLDTSPMFDYLNKCSRLRYLFVTLHEGDVGEEGVSHWRHKVGNVRVLDNLESFSLYYWNSRAGDIGYPAILDGFEFPNLKALRLDGATLNFQQSERWTEPLSNRFISRIGSLEHLTYLSLCPISVHPDTFRRIILATPRVKILDGFIYENYENFFELLIWNPDRRVLPELEMLILELDNTLADDEGEGEPIPAQHFDDFLESRMKASSPFRRVVVFSSREHHLDEGVPFVQVALKYVALGLCFKPTLVKENRSRKVNHLWVERDPELQDWPELCETHS